MDLQNKIALGTAIFGSTNIDTGASRSSAEVVSDAVNGEVDVIMKDDEGNDQVVTIPCDGDLRTGDSATILIQDGVATALSAGGAGERARQETETAQDTATQAATDATAAKDKATQAADAATAAKDTATQAADAATAAKDKAEDAAAAATTAQSTAKNAAAAASTAQTTAKQAADAASAEARRAQSAEEEALTAAQNAGLAASTAQAAADAAKSVADTAKTTADKTAKYFYYDSLGAHVISGDTADHNNLLLTNDAVYIRDGETTVSKFAETSCSLNKGAYSIDTYVNSSTNTTVWAGAEKDWGTSYTGKTVLLRDLVAFNYTKSGSTYQLLCTASSASITSSSSGTFTAQVHVGSDNSNIALTTTIHGGTIVVGNSYTDSINLVGTSIKANNNNIGLLAYPVGAIYISTTSTSPATLFGGTWTQLSAGQFLIAAGSSDYKAGDTGGSTSHSHTVSSHSHTMSHTHGIASHSHTMAHTHTLSHTHTVASHTHTMAHTHTYGLRLGAHYSAFVSSQGSNTFDLWNGSAWQKSDTGASDQATISFNTPVANGSGTTSKAISRPSKTCATSASSAASTGSASPSTGAASTSTTSGASATNTGSTSASTNSQSTTNTGSTAVNTTSANNLPPYLAVYMWKRTA